MTAVNATRRFLCSYEFDGEHWSIEVWASTQEEAEMKLRAIGTGKVDGRVVGTVVNGASCPVCRGGVEPTQ